MSKQKMSAVEGMRRFLLKRKAEAEAALTLTCGEVDDDEEESDTTQQPVGDASSSSGASSSSSIQPAPAPAPTPAFAFARGKHKHGPECGCTKKGRHWHCTHGRAHASCVKCGGVSICEHGRRRNICKDCGGSQICEHGRQHTQCKDCDGANICQHSRQRASCKKCGGSQICEHGRQRPICKDCDGSCICEHGRVRSICKDCDGSCICEHGRVRSICKDCGGSQICEHGRVRSKCKDCDGSQICAHGKIRQRCFRCTSQDQQNKSGKFCFACSTTLIGRNRMLKYGGPGICAQCDDRVQPRTEHLIRPKLLALVETPPDAIDDAMFGVDCEVDKQRRPDVLWSVRAADDGRVVGTVKVGCDEDSHDDTHDKTRAEHLACEVGKVGNQFESLVTLAWREDVLRAEDSGATISWRMLTGKAMESRERVAEDVPMRGLAQFYLKFNPDAYDGGRAPLWTERIPVVAAHVNALIRRIRDGTLGDGFDYAKPHVSFHYYHSKCDDIVDAFRAHGLVYAPGDY